ncbi:alpha/beta-hydrolase [Violaceomyces palustris]|uniref:Alpha/beta-hydrolase n=1 Tax=Violaceomyces palustris TaxID=1673888 RepID=A0ACD0NPA3_9BASI|nr:alpha/beta-hydrolase [Violaceomyces palustris]
MIGFFFAFYHIFLEPILCHFNLVAPGFGDPTYGREKLPYSKAELRIIHDNPEVTVIRRKVPLYDTHTGQAGKRQWSWVSYNIWVMEDVEAREGLHSDVVLVHGLNDYAGKLAPHAHHFMKRGFRIIAIDLPSFGRSTGLHAHVPSMRINVSAMHAVIMDVRKWDLERDPSGLADRERKLFAEGHSMGAFTVLYYAALYSPIREESNGHPSQELESTPDSPSPYRPHLSGVAVAAPMISISPESRPGPVVEYIAKAICFFSGRLPFAKAIRGNVSDDPRVEEEFMRDPQTYKGLLRISTGLAVLYGIQELEALAPKITCPLAIHHGSNDRATSPKGSEEFFRKVGTAEAEKMLKIWEGYEHVMMKNVEGMSQEDEERRDVILRDINVTHFSTNTQKKTQTQTNKTKHTNIRTFECLSYNRQTGWYNRQRGT